MNYQEDFNRAYLGIRDQGFEQAIAITCNNETRLIACVLLARDGKRCAIGHLVNDASIGDALSEQAKELLSDSFYRELQQAHDLGHIPEKMQRQLRGVAAAYHLTVPGEDEQ